LANLLLMAHIAIPHHHHQDDEVCFFVSHCQDSNEDHHNHSSPCEQEGNPISGNCCFVDNVYLLADNNLKINCRSHINCHCKQILFAPVPAIFNLEDDTVFYFLQKPYVPIFYSEFISQSIGLRAPPAC